jgi:hypothetical protein
MPVARCCVSSPNRRAGNEAEAAVSDRRDRATLTSAQSGQWRADCGDGRVGPYRPRRSRHLRSCGIGLTALVDQQVDLKAAVA